MEPKKPSQASCSSPFQDLPFSSSSSTSLLKDISNFKTPKHSRKANFISSSPSPYRQPEFFTALKTTPVSSVRRRGSIKPSAVKSSAARRLKAFELEQSKSARKALNDKERSLKSLAKSLTVWLNFLFENPSSCGCDVTKFTGGFERSNRACIAENGKRESGPGYTVGVDVLWRGPKRQRHLLSNSEDEETTVFSDSMFFGLKDSLMEICSFDDLKERMSAYLSLGSCKEVFLTMTQLTKTIDEGRLKMRAHCPLVTDVGMKEKALKILMCYNPTWLWIGLHIILGGDTLLPNGDVNSEQEIAFLKMVLERQFFSHVGLAKTYAYNKLVEGLYRPGYYEKLGNIVLKRFLLLVLILDRVKTQSSLPLKYGIDGLDGGSPLLFSSQSDVKSSRQLINKFLPSDVMHGEGNLLAHLVIVGYKVTYQQNPLLEYQFGVADLFEDLQDGIQLCRVVQLLRHDPSILSKMVVPSDTRKKSLANCGTVLLFLQEAGVSLCDQDGTILMAEDIVGGDKELTISLLWNMFVHLQLPLLINKSLLSEEISKIQGVVKQNSNDCTHLDMLLSWIQAICGSYDLKVKNFSSLVDGKAMWCLLDYYFRKDHRCSCSYQALCETKEEVSIVSAVDYTDAVHNFILSQKLPLLLGKFPEVIQVSDILETNGACNGQSVIILLVFLSYQLLVKRNKDQLNFHKLLGFNCQSPERRRLSTDQWFMHPQAAVDKEQTHWKDGEDAARNFKAVMAWWQEMAQQNNKCFSKETSSSPKRSFIVRGSNDTYKGNAAKVIQSHFRQSVQQRKYLRIKNAVYILQAAIQAWLWVKREPSIQFFGSPAYLASLCGTRSRSANFEKHAAFVIDRHAFLKLKRSVIIIQRASRDWIYRKHVPGNSLLQDLLTPTFTDAAIVIQKCIRGWIARSCLVNTDQFHEVPKECEDNIHHINTEIAIQCASNEYELSSSLHSHHFAATKIQSYYRGWLMRKNFVDQKQATIKIQSIFQSARCLRDFHSYKQETLSVITIQAYIRRWIAKRDVYRHKSQIIMIQSHCRGWLTRRKLLIEKEAVIRIQTAVRSLKYRKAFLHQKHAVLEIQRFARGAITRKRLLGASCYRNVSKLGYQALELKILLQAVVKLQRWWRCKLLHAQRTKAAVVIQSHVLGWIARKRASRSKERLLQAVLKLQRWWRSKLLHEQRTKAAVVIQSHILGWLVRQSISRNKDQLLQATLKLQRWWRDKLLHKQKTKAAVVIQSHVQGWKARQSASRKKHLTLLAVLKLQRWWRGKLLHKQRTKSAIVIQSHVRGWISRQSVSRNKHRIVVIQAYMKGYLARKDLRGQLLDLRLKIQKSAANVDNGMRIINRLVAALSELLNMRSVSDILHICATLNMATQHSEKCCEELVAAGAVGTLFKLIRSLSRSIPDQEVLKPALSTLRNLSRYPHLIDVLIESCGSLETIVSEFLRNKEEGYFIASDLLKKIFTENKGVEAVRKSPALLKRLHNHVEELSRRAKAEKRTKPHATKEPVDKRLREAVEILELIKVSMGNPTRRLSMKV
ncbi:abnormal spindle-like microcephaly-associated protein homolog [Solanum pennellii]|uniref:Abnormal spindle-like microcephaly-associated protein homolog n=1 Tax=Solanum pennellii TaxID=28526 RepID=A0ABM1G822_SOLPN|nr:abnormal spindle-like microcephaly-associated protein homolog [Solanum pennellii]